jgi:hypothetical protein
VRSESSGWSDILVLKRKEFVVSYALFRSDSKTFFDQKERATRTTGRVLWIKPEELVNRLADTMILVVPGGNWFDTSGDATCAALLAFVTCA